MTVAEVSRVGGRRLASCGFADRRWFPPAPHRTVHAVLPHTAHRRQVFFVPPARLPLIEHSYSSREIATHLGCSVTTVHRRVHACGDGRRETEFVGTGRGCNEEDLTPSLLWKSNETLVYGIEDKDGIAGDWSYFVGQVPVRGGKAIRPIHKARFPSLAADGRRIAYVSNDLNDVYIASYPTGQPEHHVAHSADDVWNVAWSPDRRWLALDTTRYVVDLSTLADTE